MSSPRGSAEADRAGTVSRLGRSELGGVLMGAVAMVLGSAAVGILVNHFSPRGIPILGKGEELQLPLPPGVDAMGVEQARAMLDAKSAVFIDARVPEEYGNSHVPTALNLPPDAFAEKYPDLAEQLEAVGTVIVYCEGMECGDSILVAEQLREAFSGAVYVVERGWPSWVAAGYPVTSGVRP